MSGELSSGGRIYYCFDALGSTSEVLDNTGATLNRYEYLPFGSLLYSSTTVSNTFQFVGESGVANELAGLRARPDAADREPSSSMQVRVTSFANSCFDDIILDTRRRRRTMDKSVLRETAENLVAPGKGILAADESFGTIKKRFDALRIESTADTRRNYRDMLLTTRGIEQFISGVIDVGD